MDSGPEARNDTEVEARLAEDELDANCFTCSSRTRRSTERCGAVPGSCSTTERSIPCVRRTATCCTGGGALWSRKRQGGGAHQNPPVKTAFDRGGRGAAPAEGG